MQQPFLLFCDITSSEHEITGVLAEMKQVNNVSYLNLMIYAYKSMFMLDALHRSWGISIPIITIR